MFEVRIVIHSYLTAHKASHSVPIKMFYSILLFSIVIATTEEHVFEGEGVTLSCNYTGSYNTDTLLWYQQYPRSKPEFLLLITEGRFKTHNKSTHPRLSVKLNDEKTHVDLEISSAEVTDSALYYFALSE
uniref:Ig-like domain-containing protein n=1 Tax=Hucho hucho TaxID=62062 RepID=A0A4W5KLW3_9TELE